MAKEKDKIIKEEVKEFLEKTKDSNEIPKKAISNFVLIKDSLNEIFSNIEANFKESRGIEGLPSGYPSLDRITSGFQNSDLIVIASEPGIGKTSLAINIAEFLAIKKRKSIAMFTLEMSRSQLIKRFLCSQGKVDLGRLMRGFLCEEDWAKLAEAYGELHDAPIYIDDSYGLTFSDIQNKARKLKNETNVDMIIVDYLQLIHSEENKEYRASEVAHISRGFKDLAKELNIPVVVLSQLDIAKRTDYKPTLSNFKESWSIGQDADVVIFLNRSDELREENIEVIVAKQRNGPTDKFHLIFLSGYTKFVEVIDQN